MYKIGQKVNQANQDKIGQKSTSNTQISLGQKYSNINMNPNTQSYIASSTDYQNSYIPVKDGQSSFQHGKYSSLEKTRQRKHNA